MKRNHTRMHRILLIFIIMITTFACNWPRQVQSTFPAPVTLPSIVPNSQTDEPLSATQTHEVETPFNPLLSPTPDPIRQLPPMRREADEYTIQSGDTLAGIARRYWIGLHTLVIANEIDNPNLIQVGEVLTIPAPAPIALAPGFKILPDAAVVFGPPSVGFDLEGLIAQAGGFLANYSEKVDDKERSGVQIVLRVSQDYSVSPLLLLALLEYTGGWITETEISEPAQTYPIGFETSGYEGLYAQLAWAANEINRGYYQWRVNAIPNWVLEDDNLVTPDTGVNAGTAGIQYVLALLLGYSDWKPAVEESGLHAVYEKLFGNPFAAAYDPLIPADLVQPDLILPFEPGRIWRFTGAPHGAFGGGAAWAALDFAPPGEALGCVSNDAWVTAMTDGMIIRSGRGQVIQDLDGDGNEQTGWVLQYLHIETRDRVEKGVFLQSGDRIGHPSCEGAYSTGTHVHIARRYNGEWIPADGAISFNLEGWISSGTGIAYNGYLTKNGTSIPALVGNSPENQIQR